MAESSRSARSTAKKAAARSGPRADKADGESAVLATLAAMPEPDRALGERFHAVIYYPIYPPLLLIALMSAR